MIIEGSLLDAFRTNSRNIIDRNPSLVIPMLANQDLMPMLSSATRFFVRILNYSLSLCHDYIKIFADVILYHKAKLKWSSITIKLIYKQH